MADTDSPNPSFSHGRRWLNWLNTLLAIASVFAIVVLVNYLAGGHYERIEVDRNSPFKLSEQTVHVLDALTNDVHVTIFFDPHGGDEDIYLLTSSLLTEYQQTSPRRIHVKTIDYNREVGAAKEFLATNHLESIKEKNFVFFECAGQTKLVNAKDLSNYDFSDLISGHSKYVRRNAFLGEMLFTADIYAVSNPHPMKAYFLFGHGENDPEETNENSGYSKFAGILKNEVNCDWSKLILEGTNKIPGDCALLIVPASARQGQMTPDVQAKISAYLKQGGRLMALLTKTSGLEPVLTNWGIEIGDSRLGRVVDTNRDFMLSDSTFLTAKLGPHPIMNLLASEKMPLVMFFPRWVAGVEAKTKVPGAPEITILAATSSDGLNVMKEKGVYPLIAAVEQGTIQGVNSAGGRGTRIVVAGDSDFLDDQVIDSVGNHTFAAKALGWLLQRPQIVLSGMGPRPIKEYKLFMTHGQSQALTGLFLAGLPGAVLLLGGLVWLRRRS